MGLNPINNLEVLPSFYAKIKTMFNWSVDEEYFQKQDPSGFEVWRLLQLINYGLDGEKLSKNKLRKFWPQIKDKIFDPGIRHYLTQTLWPKKAS